MVRLSTKIKTAVKLSPMRSYQIAQAAQMHPSTLSRIMCGIDTIRENDERVLRVAKIVGVPADECFEKEAN